MATAPPLSPVVAGGLAIVYTLLLVLPFYASPITRPRFGFDRNDDLVIRTRIRLVTGTCVVCTAVTVTLLRYHLGFDWKDTLHLLGWWPVGRHESRNAVLLVGVLFAGPFFEKAFAEERAKRWVTGEPLEDDMKLWTWWRNIVVGPISEELIFRSLLVPLYLLSTSSRSTLPLDSPATTPILLSPLPFALAHVYHLHESRTARPHVPLLAHVATAVLQFAYTALFGWFAAFLFARTASLLSCILCHAFCNWMGLPRVWGRVRKLELFGDGFALVPLREVDADADAGAADDDADAKGEGEGKGGGHNEGTSDTGLRQRNAGMRSASSEDNGERDGEGDEEGEEEKRNAPTYTPMILVRPTSTAWDASTLFCTITYYALLPAGAFGFYVLLWPWTETGTGLVKNW